MKILAIGDFHGKFPARLKKLARKVDLVLCTGDFFPFSYRGLFFKYSYGKDVELWEVIGKKKVKNLVLKDLKEGERVLKDLDNLGVPVISVVGNVDYTRMHDSFDEDKSSKRSWKWEAQDFFSKIIKKYKNLHRFDYAYVTFGDLTFVGTYGHTFPGKVKSHSYKKHKLILEKMFRMFGKKNREGKVIFVGHNMPYDCKLDKISSKDAPKVVRGEHYGSKMTRRIINKYQPVLFVGGHHHENQGKVNIGKTLVVNPGAAVDGKAAIIDFDTPSGHENLRTGEDKGKVKSVEFFR